MAAKLSEMTGPSSLEVELPLAQVTLRPGAAISRPDGSALGTIPVRREVFYMYSSRKRRLLADSAGNYTPFISKSPQSIRKSPPLLQDHIAALLLTVSVKVTVSVPVGLSAGLAAHQKGTSGSMPYFTVSATDEDPLALRMLGTALAPPNMAASAASL